MTALAGSIQILSQTAAEWALENRVLLLGQLGFDTTNRLLKKGDGVTAWNTLTSSFKITAGDSMKAVGTDGAEIVLDVNQLFLFNDDSHDNYLDLNNSYVELAHVAAIYLTSPITEVTGVFRNGAVEQKTGTALEFTNDSNYGTVASPETGNITATTTGAKLGIKVVVIHNHSVAPTFDSKFKKLSGTYVTGSLNYIACQYLSSTTIVYTISQEGGGGGGGSVNSVTSGDANEITIGGTAADPTIAIAAAFSSAITAEIAAAVAAKSSYVIQASNDATFSPLNDTRYFFGSLTSGGPTTTESIRRLPIPKTGIIKAVSWFFRNPSTLSTTENATMNIRVNAGADNLVSGALQFNVANQNGGVSGLNIAVTGPTDYIELNLIGTWATRPGSILMYIEIFIET